MTDSNSLHPRLRVRHGDEIALGPGKADLLDAIEKTGTLGGAAQLLGMSYMRAWKLVQTMNACFREPLVETSRGGNLRGSAALTATGRAVRDLYRRMEAESLRATEADWKELSALLRSP
jgi:molybdate transport system regulatory protein